jgi:glycosyl transferase family 25
MPGKFDDLRISIFVISDPNIRPSKILSLLENEGIKHRKVSPIFLKHYPAEFNSKRSQVLSKKRLSLSEIGCATAHLSCYSNFLESGDDFALVFEDDAHLIDSNLDSLYDLTRKFLEFKKATFKHESIAMLYYSESANVIQANEYFYNIVGNASHAMAYLINRLSAMELLKRNAQYDYVADWPKGTEIKFFLPKIKLFEHGSKNGSVESFIELGRLDNTLNFQSKIIQNLKIIFFVAYFKNISFFSGISDYIRILWMPIFQWQYFRILSNLFPNSRRKKIVRN